MKICVVAAADASNLAILNILREFEKRGHTIDIYTYFTDANSTRMFSKLKADLKNVAQLTQDIIAQYDIAFCGTDAMHHLIWFDIYVFSYNFIMNEWTTAGADFMFTAMLKRRSRWKEVCPTIAVGVAKNDTPIGRCIGKQILYIDAGHIPFGHKGKEQVADMLLDICNAYPDYKLVVKPRWLLQDRENQTHRNSEHIYNLLEAKTMGELPANLVLLDKHLDLQTLIDESDCVVTTSISCYMDAALRGKGVIVVGGLDCEDQYQLRKNVALKQDYEYALDAKCVVDYKDIIKYLPYGIKVSDEHICKIVPCRWGASSHVVDIVEYVYGEFLKKGVYPQIKDYTFNNYKNEIEIDLSLNMQELKYLRIKNAIIGTFRMFSYIDVNIDLNEWYKELNNVYKKYSLNERGLQDLKIYMQSKWNELLVKNKLRLMDDSINQSYLLKALFVLGFYDDICSITPEKILCIGPYHFYMARICRKQCEIPEALGHYIKYIEENQCRTYEKYFEDSNFAVKEAYSFIFEKCNKYTIEPKCLAEIYLSLYKHEYQRLIGKDLLVNVHSLIPVIVEQLEENNEFIIAKECLDIYARNIKTLVIDVYEAKIHNIEIEKERIKTSVSYKVGRGITWFPRKIRKVFKSLRQGGVAKVWNNNIVKMKRVIEEQHIFQITNTFFEKVLRGFNIYEKVMREYGSNAELFLSAEATGDAYIYGMMLKSYVNRNYPDKEPVYGVFGRSSVTVAKLFGIRNCISLSKDEFHFLYNLLMFALNNILHMKSLHYHCFYKHICILSYVEGIHNLNILSQAMFFLDIQNSSEFVKPTFFYDNKSLDELFRKLKCVQNRTILLSPYAKSVKSIPMYFWIQLTERLKEKGFSVCTNSIGETEPPIYGTTAVFIPYDQSVPFVERAGAVIGLRSGFLDVVSSAKCLKISLCNENNYKRGICHISESFSLSAMYEEPDQYDFLYSAETSMDLLDQLVRMVSDEFESEE